VGRGTYAIGDFAVGVAGPATYRVEFDVNKGRPDWDLSSEVHSAWTFRSQRPPTAARTPVPTLTAKWDLDLDPANAAPAGRDFAVRLKTGHTVPTSAAVRSAKAWISFDDGGTWKKISLTGTGGQFTSTVRHPAAHDTTGYAALRFEVIDTAGGKFEQTVHKAYVLK